MVNRTTAGLRTGLATAAVALGAAMPAAAQDPVFSFADLSTFDGEESGWYGYRTDQRYLILNATDPKAVRYFSFDGDAMGSQFTISVGFLEGDVDSNIGLFCCRQQDGNSPYLAFVMAPGNRFEVLKIDPAAALVSTVLQIDDVAAHPLEATLATIQTEHGFDLLVDGEPVGSYSEASIRPGSTGIFVWGIGAYAINDFLIYDEPPAGPADSSSDGRPSLFGR